MAATPEPSPAVEVREAFDPSTIDTPNYASPSFPCAKTVSLSHSYIKTIFLPRQARDKHRENSKETVFLVREPPPPSLQPVSENSTASLRTLSFRFDKTITGFAKTGFGHTKTRERNGSEW
eukprot:COSAG06_NODE_1700_length_8675_cov_3.485774_3_plen_121_part_00